MTHSQNERLAESIERVKKSLEQQASPEPQVQPFGQDSTPSRRSPNNIQIQFLSPNGGQKTQQHLREEPIKNNRKEMSGSVLKLIPPSVVKPIAGPILPFGEKI